MYFYIFGCDVAQFVILSLGILLSLVCLPCLFCEPKNDPVGWWRPPQHDPEINVGSSPFDGLRMNASKSAQKTIENL